MVADKEIVCGADIHRDFLVATMISRNGFKLQENFKMNRDGCGVLKLFRARPNLICFNLFIYSSQPEQSMTDGKIGFKGHFSPKSHLWSLQALEIQASMRSIVIPVDKLLE